MLHARQLTKRFGAFTALDALDLALAEGELFGLLGPNGAGKTTTIQLFLGFLDADAGSRSVNGVDVARDPERARSQLGYIPENVALYPWLTGRENLRFFADLAGQRLTGADADDALARVGLAAAAAGRLVSGYSKGMRQKVGIAIALAKRARVLLLDEPTSGLDPQASGEFSDTLRRVTAEGVTVLMATHDLFRAREICHRLGIMKQGRLVERLEASSLSLPALEALYLQHMRA
jgi:ABC-2 type transport system ATP-binding protein